MPVRTSSCTTVPRLCWKQLMRLSKLPAFRKNQSPLSGLMLWQLSLRHARLLVVSGAASCILLSESMLGRHSSGCWRMVSAGWFGFCTSMPSHCVSMCPSPFQLLYARYCAYLSVTLMVLYNCTTWSNFTIVFVCIKLEMPRITSKSCCCWLTLVCGKQALELHAGCYFCVKIPVYMLQYSSSRIRQLNKNWLILVWLLEIITYFLLHYLKTYTLFWIVYTHLICCKFFDLDTLCCKVSWFLLGSCSWMSQPRWSLLVECKWIATSVAVVATHWRVCIPICWGPYHLIAVVLCSFRYVPLIF